jgi:hypothetical protein
MAGVMLLLFLSGSETRNAGCDGPNETRVLLGLAPDMALGCAIELFDVAFG